MVGILVSFKIPTLSYFRFLFCLPAFYILIASSFKLNTKLGKILFILVLIVNLSSSGYYLFNKTFQREDWRSAAKAISKNKIILPANSQKEALIYYGKENQIVTIDNINKKNKEIWLSRYVWEIFDPQDLTRKNLENLGYNKAQELNFNGVVFWRYIRK